MDNTFFMPSVETLPGINAKKAKLQNSAPIKYPERSPDVEECLDLALRKG